MTSTRRTLVALSLACSVPLAGCSSSSSAAADPGGGGQDAGGCTPFDDAGYTPSSSPSFRNDVIPIFAGSCAFSSCHNDPTSSQLGLYLGPNLHDTAGSPSAVPPYYPPDNATLQQIWAGIVGAAPKETSAMPLVKQGDPGQSYLMHKIDGDQTCSNIPCSGQYADCGVQMPQGSPPITAAQATTIRDWIASGGKLN